MAAVSERIKYFIIIFSLGKESGCKQCVSLDICRNSFLYAGQMRPSGPKPPSNRFQTLLRRQTKAQWKERGARRRDTLQRESGLISWNYRQ